MMDILYKAKIGKCIELGKFIDENEGEEYDARAYFVQLDQYYTDKPISEDYEFRGLVGDIIVNINTGKMYKHQWDPNIKQRRLRNL